MFFFDLGFGNSNAISSKSFSEEPYCLAESFIPSPYSSDEESKSKSLWRKWNLLTFKLSTYCEEDSSILGEFPFYVS